MNNMPNINKNYIYYKSAARERKRERKREKRRKQEQMTKKSSRNGHMRNVYNQCVNWLFIYILKLGYTYTCIYRQMNQPNSVKWIFLWSLFIRALSLNAEFILTIMVIILESFSSVHNSSHIFFSSFHLSSTIFTDYFIRISLLSHCVPLSLFTHSKDSFAQCFDAIFTGIFCSLFAILNIFFALT